MNKLEAALMRQPNKLKSYLLTGMSLGIVLMWSLPVLHLQSFDKNGLKVAQNIFYGLFHPDLHLFSFNEEGVFFLVLQTISIAILGTLFGAFIAVPVSFFAATNVVPRPVAYGFRFLVMCIRTIPAFVYGLMFVRVSPGSTAGVLALSFISIGMISKLFIETIEDLDPGVMESLDAAGANLFAKIRYGIVGQLTPDFLSILIYRLDMNLREVTILGLVGAGGIGAPLVFAINAYKWNQVGSLLLGLFVLILLMEDFSARLRNYLLRGKIQ